MKSTKTTVFAAMWIATAAAIIGLAAPAHADSPVNLTVTDDVRDQLVQAGSVLTGRPASEFTGLRPGKTYYAYQPSSVNPTYWAAAPGRAEVGIGPNQAVGPKQLHPVPQRRGSVSDLGSSPPGLVP